MKSSNYWAGRYVSVVLILLLAFPMSEAGLARAQQASENAPTGPNPSVGSALPEAPAPANPQAAVPGQQATPPQPADGQPQENPHQPVGAAAAPYEPTMGIAASRPAGAAIAPAKQCRVRTILISLGVIAGAGIAVGSVAALSHGSPSRP
jgi:hypothetical protein